MEAEADTIFRAKRVERKKAGKAKGSIEREREQDRAAGGCSNGPMKQKVHHARKS